MRRGVLIGAWVAVFVLGGAALLVPLLRRGGDGPVPIGGPFSLQDGDGRTVTDASLRGRWALVYFGYTHCPDACPTALSDMTRAVGLLGPVGKAVVPVFITVDPERDTPAVMKDYVSAFDVPIMALSGSPAAVAQAEGGYHVFAAKHPTSGGEYDMDHSSIIYVMNPRGQFVTSFTHQSDPQEMADTLRRLGA